MPPVVTVVGPLSCVSSAVNLIGCSVCVCVCVRAQAVSEMASCYGNDSEWLSLPRVQPAFLSTTAAVASKPTHTRTHISW